LNPLYIFPRETNRVLRQIFEAAGGRIVDEVYVPVQPDEIAIRHAVDRIKRDRPAAVVSTIIGRTTQSFYRIFAEAGHFRHLRGREAGKQSVIQGLIPAASTGFLRLSTNEHDTRTPLLAWLLRLLTVLFEILQKFAWCR
jgi:hypothetical protein